MSVTLNSDSQNIKILEAISLVRSKFAEIFLESTAIPPERQQDHSIPLKPGSQPFKLKPCRYPYSKKSEIEQQVLKMLDKRLIRTNTSPFASPVLLVRKKDNS